MHYPIGLLSKLYGLSKEALRFYEKQGILHALRDESNGYRYYTERDAQKLGAMRRMQKIGFSLKEANGVYQSSSMENIVAIYKEKAALLQGELRLKQLILKKLEGDQILLQQAITRPYVFAVEAHPAYDMLKIVNADQLLTDPPMVEAMGGWCEEFMPASFVLTLRLHTEQGLCAFNGRGIVLERALVEEFGLETTHINQRVEAGTALRGMVTWAGGSIDLQRVGDALFSAAKTEQVQLGSAAYIISVITFLDKDGVHHFCGDLLAPLA